MPGKILTGKVIFPLCRNMKCDIASYFANNALHNITIILKEKLNRNT